MKKLALLTLLLSFIIMSSVASAAVVDIYGCTVISMPNSLYRLWSGASGGAVCMDFSAFTDNTTLDLQGHTVSGATDCVRIFWSKNVTIKNGVLDGCIFGVDALNSRGSSYAGITLQNLIINNSGQYGVVFGAPPCCIPTEIAYNLTLQGVTVVNSGSYDSYSFVDQSSLKSCDVYIGSYYPLYGGTKLAVYPLTGDRCPCCYNYSTNACNSCPAPQPACQVCNSSSLSQSVFIEYLYIGLCLLANLIVCSPVIFAFFMFVAIMFGIAMKFKEKWLK